MYTASNHSKKEVATVIQPMRDLYYYILKYMDVKALEGWRGRERQNKLFDDKISEVQFPNGKHNLSLIMKKAGQTGYERKSDALDFEIYVDGKVTYDPKYYIMMWGIARSWADLHGVILRWGGNWDNDQVIIDDQSFNDLMHIECIGFTRKYGMAT